MVSVLIQVGFAAIYLTLGHQVALLFTSQSEVVELASRLMIITGIFLIISIPLMFVLIGFVTFAVALVVAFVLHLIGAIKANNGEWWNPPMTPRFVR